jgi:glucan phosphoethanolaminetransferase (alkaline phosphatase superfamily)
MRARTLTTILVVLVLLLSSALYVHKVLVGVEINPGSRYYVGAFVTATAWILLWILMFKARDSDRAYGWAVTAALIPLLPGYGVLLLAPATVLLAGYRGAKWPWLLLILGAGWIYQYAATYGIHPETIAAVLQTHSTEVLDFVSMNTSLRFVVFALALLTILVARQLVIARPAYLAFAAPLAVVLCTVAVFAPVVPALRDFRKLERTRPVLVQASGVGAPTPQQYAIVFVLGESTSRWNFGRYGYPYETTPRLAALGDKIVWLSDAISVHSHTGPVVEELFLRETEWVGGHAAAHSLLDRLETAGVTTSWFSSQAALGPWDNPAHTMARAARTRKYFGETSFPALRNLAGRFGTSKGFTGDEEMVAEVHRHLHSTAAPSLLVVHLTAAHTDYCRNLPLAAQNEFAGMVRAKNFFGNFDGSQRDVNCYDAAIKYIDSILSSIIGSATRSTTPTVVIYAPDHGEDVFASTGHNSAAHSSRHIEIPVAFYANAAARQLDRPKWDALVRNAHKPFLNSWLHEAVLDIFGLAAHYGANEDLSVFSNSYSPKPRTIFPRTNPLSYDGFTDFDRKDYLGRTRANLHSFHSSGTRRPRHIFAHRMDSELALIEAVKYFKGVELDIVFNERTGQFDVHHPPAPATGFTLERALQIISDLKDPTVWLDWKNPANGNLNQALNELARVTKRFGLLQKVIIETEPNYVDAQLSQIREMGFRHSYYMPPEITVACSAGERTENCEREYDRLVAVVRRVKPTCVSFEARAIRFAKRIAAATDTQCLLTWDIDIDSAKQDFVARVSKYREVDGLIVKFPTRFGY